MSTSSLPENLFIRQWELTFFQPGGGFGTSYDSLRVTFDIDKTSYGTPGKSKIEIYNLTAEQRKNITVSNAATGQTGDIIQLKAGYRDLVGTVFSGNLARAKSERKGSGSIVTILECGDSEYQMTYANMQQSYPPGVTLVQIIKDCAQKLGVGIGTIIGVPTKVYNSGVALSGSIKTILNVVLYSTGLEWSIQNGALNILPINAHLGDEGVLLSGETGLINVTSQGEEFVQFSALLNPRLLPGSYVVLESQNVKGSFKIRRSKFTGDSHGAPWQVECEAVPIVATQSLPANRGLTFGSVVA